MGLALVFGGFFYRVPSKKNPAVSPFSGASPRIGRVALRVGCAMVLVGVAVAGAASI
jgi:hypothetical protein